jgi:hypothetical protein
MAEKKRRLIFFTSNQPLAPAPFAQTATKLVAALFSRLFAKFLTPADPASLYS